MENIYNNLLDKCNRQVKNSCQSFTQADGKKRYTVTTENRGDTIYTSEVSIAKLDGESLDYDPIDYVDVDDLLADDISMDDLFDNFNERVTFANNGKVKIDGYIAEELQTDKIITVKKGSITGLIVDLKRDEDFTDAYYNGITCNMPNCKRYADEFANHGDDIEENDLIDLLDENELTGFIETLRSKVQSATELYPQGLYVIINNRIYYLTADEYRRICYDSEYESRMYRLYEDPGIHQIESKLLDDKKQTLYTISQIIKSKYLTNKKYIDMNDETSIGTTKETFLTNLLSSDKETFEFLATMLKPKENTK